jgi:hypothetical protein
MNLDVVRVFLIYASSFPLQEMDVTSLLQAVKRKFIHFNNCIKVKIFSFYRYITLSRQPYTVSITLSMEMLGKYLITGHNHFLNLNLTFTATHTTPIVKTKIVSEQDSTSIK